VARLFSNRERPFDMGVLPTELLARDPDAPIGDSQLPKDVNAAGSESILAAIPEYRDLCIKYFDGEVAAKRAPVPDDPLTRARNMKASAYFLDATLAGVCRIEDSDWVAKDHPPHTHAFVFLVEFGRFAAFIHPLSPLTAEQVVSAIRQVASARATFGDSYSSGGLFFR